MWQFNKEKGQVRQERPLAQPDRGHAKDVLMGRLASAAANECLVHGAPSSLLPLELYWATVQYFGYSAQPSNTRPSN